jgi:hypothetical protein
VSVDHFLYASDAFATDQSLISTTNQLTFVGDLADVMGIREQLIENRCPNWSEWTCEITLAL